MSTVNDLKKETPKQGGFIDSLCNVDSALWVISKLMSDTTPTFFSERGATCFTYDPVTM